MAIPCPPSKIEMSVIAAEFGVGLNNTQLSRELAPFIGKSYGSKVAMSEFCGASANSGPDASGGTEWYNPSNGWTNHIFTSYGTFCITKAGVGGVEQTTIRYLICAGGAGGGSGGFDAREKREFGAGGGAGGMKESTVPNTETCYINTIGAGGYGASAVDLARGGQGAPSSIRSQAGSSINSTSGGGGGGSFYNNQWDGGYGGSGGGGGGKYQGTAGTVGGNGVTGQGNKGGAGGSAGAGGGGGIRTNGNSQNFDQQAGGGGGGGITYDPMSKGYSVGGGGAGAYGGGSGYNQGGDGGVSIGGRGTATAAVREGCGGGGGGSGGHSNGGENGKNGKNGIVVYSFKK